MALKRVGQQNLGEPARRAVVLDHQRQTHHRRQQQHRQTRNSRNRKAAFQVNQAMASSLCISKSSSVSTRVSFPAATIISHPPSTNPPVLLPPWARVCPATARFGGFCQRFQFFVVHLRLGGDGAAVGRDDGLGGLRQCQTFKNFLGGRAPIIARRAGKPPRGRRKLRRKFPTRPGALFAPRRESNSPGFALAYQSRLVPRHVFANDFQHALHGFARQRRVVMRIASGVASNSLSVPIAWILPP